jgi:sulfite reductase alpha subunit-like flavoprotein
MSDSLGAAEQFTQFDDEHLSKYGYRLPSDPYWIAPPQGSIIPLWHRGGAPNYQPKPMICRHAQDPVKAWRREQLRRSKAAIIDARTTLQVSISVRKAAPLTRLASLKPRIFIGFCSSGNVAIKLCKRLYSQLQQFASQSPNLERIMPVTTLDALPLDDMTKEDVLVIVASTTGRGLIPQNGKGFVDRLTGESSSLPCRYAIFGNGSTDYPDTYNQAALDIEGLLSHTRSVPLFDMVEADTAQNTPPWDILNQFYRRLIDVFTLGEPITAIHASKLLPQRRSRLAFDTASWFNSKIHIHSQPRATKQGMKRVTIDMGGKKYGTMSSLWLLPPNQDSAVNGILTALNIGPNERLDFPSEPTASDFLKRFADIDRPFRTLEWTENLRIPESIRDDLGRVPIVRSVHQLPPRWRDAVSLTSMIQAMPTIQPREYSIASDLGYSLSCGRGNIADLLVQHHQGGKFSDIFLNSLVESSEIAFKVKKNPSLERLVQEQHLPLIVFTIGSGIAPVRSLIQHRLRHQSSKGLSDPPAQISLFAGFKEEDPEIIQEAVTEGHIQGLFDILELMPSNASKKRVQDAMLRDGIREVIREKIRDGAMVFACARPQAIEDFVAKLGVVLEADAREILGERFVAEVYEPAT